MKKLLTAIALVGSFAAFAGTPVETVVPVDHIYSPKGFDSNDDSQVMISGYLPNLCHKSPMSKVEVKGKKIEITMSALKYDANNPYCAEVIVPFVESVSLGVLDKGLYDIVVNGKTLYEKKSNLFVEETTSAAVDDHIYAAVEYIEKQEGTRTVLLKGYNPSDCFQLEEIKWVDNGRDTFSVLPIMKRTSSHCPMKLMPFEYEFEVPETLTSDLVLLHVRSMDGKSVNTVFRNKL